MNRDAEPVNLANDPAAAQTSTAISRPPRAVFKAGTVLNGTYRIVRALGHGGMGDIFLAAHARLPGYFAIKALQTSLASKPEALSRFRREAEIMAGIRHPNVVQVIDFNLAPEGPYLVMELIDGPDLAAELRGGRTLTPTEVLSIVRQVASALHAAHAVGVVHRDLKPENVLLVSVPGQVSVVKVIDFGISISDLSPQITVESQVIGTPEFMSPEQALGRREEIDARSDQFALAALAHTLLARRAPFKGDTPMATLSAIIFGDPEPLAAYVTWPAEEVEPILRKGMARQREDRFPSVLDFSDALAAGLERSGALAEVPADAAAGAAAAGPATADLPAQAAAHGEIASMPFAATMNAPIAEAVVLPAPQTSQTSRTGLDFEPFHRLILPRLWQGEWGVWRTTLVTLLLLLAGVMVTARITNPVALRQGILKVSNGARDGWAKVRAIGTK